MADRFLPQLAGAAAVMGVLVAGLVWVGRQTARPAESAPVVEAPSGPTSTLALVPARAWLVLDFDSALVDARPFAGDGPPCEDVPAPARVAFSAVPDAAGELSFWLGAYPVNPAFVACASKKILAAGGKVAPSHPDWQVLEAPSGVFVSRGEAVLFSNRGGDRAELEELLRGGRPSAERSGPHAAALARWARGTPLAMSLELPEGWLKQIDPRAAELSPLRSLQGATLSIGPSGDGRGVVRCRAEGCAELESFAERAWNDFTAQVPPSSAEELRRAIGFRPPRAGAAEFELEVSPSGIQLARRLLSSWGGTNPLPQKTIPLRSRPADH
ncbi:MAG TPA: hypothetical protein VLC09_03185 [Polyangiaceae bacterium]|nr:hypothetical protein [Polyangiaceae bacterium]